MKNLRDCLGDETPRYVLIEKATPFILLHKKKGFTRYVRGSSNEDETRSFRLPSNHVISPSAPSSIADTWRCR